MTPPPVTLDDPRRARAIYDAATVVAADYHVSMGDPMYALSSAGAIVYAGRATLLRNLLTDAEEARLDGDDDGAAALQGLADLIAAAADGIEWDWDDEESVLVAGYTIAERLRAGGLPVGPPQVERGWSRGPRYVLPRVRD